MYTFTTLLQCLATTVSSARCRVVRVVSATVNKAVLAVLKIVANVKTAPLPLPPPPTRTSPLFLPPSPTTPCSHSPPWTLWLALLGALALAVVVAVLVKIGAFKRAREKIAEVLQVGMTNFKGNVLRVLVVSCNIVKIINDSIVHSFAIPVLLIGNNTVKVIVNIQGISYRLTIHVVASAITTGDFVQALSPIPASKVAAAAHVVYFLPDPWALLFPVSTLRVRPATPLGSRHWQVVAFPGVDNHIDTSTLTWICWLGRGASGQVAKLQGASATIFAVKRMKATETWRSEAAVHVAMRDHPAFPVLHGVYRAQAHRFFVMYVCVHDCHPMLTCVVQLLGHLTVLLA
ncbi:hypothetical protein C8R43DRAFT_1244574 [Mycena crocata]|nr:hypothetical protein C8R43DRAFT_1244574 [Mycena crocata]